MYAVQGSCLEPACGPGGIRSGLIPDRSGAAADGADAGLRLTRGKGPDSGPAPPGAEVWRRADFPPVKSAVSCQGRAIGSREQLFIFHDAMGHFPTGKMTADREGQASGFHAGFLPQRSGPLRAYPEPFHALTGGGGITELAHAVIPFTSMS